MKFNNKENEKIDLVDGRTIWLSRAVAVVGTICLIKDKIPYFLLSKRGKGAADYQGLWNLPCGYLDYNETSGEAFMREVWEECGVNIKKILDSDNIVVADFSESPWSVNTKITENRQNVCLHHGVVYFVDELPIPVVMNEVEEDEVEAVEWVSIYDINNFEYAFGHRERIQMFIEKTQLDKYKK